MLKKVLSYIFIYIFMIGCGDSTKIINAPNCSDCVLNLNIQDLNEDSNGYYRLNWLIGNVQTFVTIEAHVGHGYRFVGWTSNTYFDGCTWGYCEPINVVNSSSYSNEDGMAYTMLGVYEEHIGDTVMVYCGYYEDNIQYLDSLGVIIDE